MQKRASQVLIHQKRASQVLIYQNNVQKRASQIYLDPIRKHASSRSVLLNTVLLKALLHFNSILYSDDLDDLILQFYFLHNKNKNIYDEISLKLI